MKTLIYILFLTCFSQIAVSQAKETPKPVAPVSPSRTTSGGLVFISGQIPIDPQTGKLVKNGDIKAETRQVMENIGAVLKSNNMDFTNIVKCTVYLTDIRDFADMNEIYAAYFSDGKFPAREAIEVVNLPLGATIEISAIASK